MWPRALIVLLGLLAGDGQPAVALPSPSLTPFNLPHAERIIYIVDVLQDCGSAMRHPSQPECFRMTNARIQEVAILPRGGAEKAASVTEFFQAAIAMDQDVEIIMTRRAKR